MALLLFRTLQWLSFHPEWKTKSWQWPKQSNTTGSSWTLISPPALPSLTPFQSHGLLTAHCSLEQSLASRPLHLLFFPLNHFLSRYVHKSPPFRVFLLMSSFRWGFLTFKNEPCPHYILSPLFYFTFLPSTYYHLKYFSFYFYFVHWLSLPTRMKAPNGRDLLSFLFIALPPIPGTVPGT